MKINKNTHNYYLEKHYIGDKKKNIYIHKVYQLGWFRFSFYRLGKKFTIRIELSKGWD